MPRFTLRIPLALILAALSALPATAQTDLPFTAADIEAASYAGGDLPSGRSALTTKVQVLLDRSGISPGVIDGFKGGMSQSAIMAFERRSGLPIDGVMDPHVWNLLQSFAALPATKDYTITAEDAQGLVDAIPTDYAEKAQMAAMAHTSVAERLGERFHMDEKFIAFLNPGVDLVPGNTIKVVDTGSRMRGSVVCSISAWSPTHERSSSFTRRRMRSCSWRKCVSGCSVVCFHVLSAFVRAWIAQYSVVRSSAHAVRSPVACPNSGWTPKVPASLPLMRESSSCCLSSMARSSRICSSSSRNRCSDSRPRVNCTTGWLPWRRRRPA